ncbi:MAG TPA: four helix bundle protein [Pirellulales bacterium]|nr:four helix bundle protein [Pirellulales bacterium]
MWRLLSKEMTNDGMTNDERMTNDQARMTKAPVAKSDGKAARGGDPKFDMEERTARFGEAIIQFAKKVPHNVVTISLIGQLVKAGTSVGANYCEADDAVSKKEFRNKIGTCKKEARESKYWLRMIAAAEPETKANARPLWTEAKELHLIFVKIYRR